MKYYITEELAQLTLNYIAQQGTGNVPYGQVKQLTDQLMALEPVEDEKEKPQLKEAK